VGERDDLDQVLLVVGSEDAVDRMGRKLAVSDHEYVQVTDRHWLLATWHA
jgi:hypothetical protein